MMARYTVVVLSVIAVAVELVSCCSSGGGGGGGGIPRSNSGRPFGIDINDNVEVYPNARDGAVGVGVEIRPNSQLDIRVRGGVNSRDALNGKISPEGGVELEYRFRRRRSMEGASLDENTSRMLFKIFDLNQDGKIDVVDWTNEGGKLVAFSKLILTNDIDGDEKLSLEEFLQIPILPDLGLDLGLGLGRDDVTRGGEGTPSPAQE